MGRPRCSYPLIVSFVVFLLVGPISSAYANGYDEVRCYHQANKAEKIARKLERKASKACAKKYSDNVDGNYLSAFSAQSRDHKKVCFEEAEQQRANRLEVLDDVRSQCLDAAGSEVWQYQSVKEHVTLLPGIILPK